MATPSGGKDTPVPRSVMDRIAGAGRGLWNGWFGPGQPLTPIAPAEEVDGRRWDYPYGVNLAYQPRAEQGQAAVPFWLLRQLADPAQGGLDLLRLAISKRKRQMAKLRWKIQGIDGSDGGDAARKIEQVLRRPDGQRSFRQWQGMLLEDHFVIDAVAVYPRAHPDGVRLEPMDGATLKLVIDEFGRTPVPPLPAYQQFLKGVPAVDYTADELRYYATDQRSDHIYGYSRVEQVIGIVSIALNRQVSIGSYYTKGSIPEMLLQMPKELSSAKQLKEFDEFWQSLLSGNLQERWKARMIPAGATAVFAKDAILKDLFDEWLARIICFAFDLPPTSLVKETNRSVAETQKEAAEEEGLEDVKLAFKDWIDDMLVRDLGAEGLEFAYDEEAVVDQEQNARITQMLFGGTTGTAEKIITLAEARAATGYDPATAEQLTELQPPVPDPLDQPNDPAVDGSDGAPLDPKQQEAAKARKSRAGRSLLAAPQRDVAERKRVVERLASHLGPHLSAMGHTIAGVIRHGITPVAQKDDGEPDLIKRLLDALEAEDWRTFEDIVGPITGDYARTFAAQAAQDAGRASGATAPELEQMLSQANDRAIEWANRRAAALVTDLDQTTRDGVRQLVTTGLAEGMTNDQLADALTGSGLFDGTRADLIARTETAFAENAGTLEGWKASGVVEGKAWVPDAEACEECQANADDGVVSLDDDFSTGDDAPPAHPNCECTLQAVLAAVGA